MYVTSFPLSYEIYIALPKPSHHEGKDTEHILFNSAPRTLQVCVSLYKGYSEIERYYSQFKITPTYDIWPRCIGGVVMCE